MKSIGVVLSLFLVMQEAARADLIAEWTFETSNPMSAGPHAAELGVNADTSFASGVHAGASTYGGGFSTGNGSGRSYRSNNWQVGDYWQFSASTLGYEDVTLSWDQRADRIFPGVGPVDFELVYSADGVNFFSAMNYTALGNGEGGAPGWDQPPPRRPQYLITADLSGISAIENAANVVFRLVNTSTDGSQGTTVDPAGQSWIDNFAINAEATPEPNSMLLSGAALAGAVLVRRRRRATSDSTN